MEIKCPHCNKNITDSLLLIKIEKCTVCNEFTKEIYTCYKCGKHLCNECSSFVYHIGYIGEYPKFGSYECKNGCINE